MQFSVLALAPNMDRNLLFALVVLCVGAIVLRRLQSPGATGASQSWVPLTVLFGTPVFGLGVVLWEGFVVGEDSKSFDDALSDLPGVLIVSLVVGFFVYAFLQMALRKSTVRDKPQPSAPTDPLGDASAQQ